MKRDGLSCWITARPWHWETYSVGSVRVTVSDAWATEASIIRPTLEAWKRLRAVNISELVTKLLFRGGLSTDSRLTVFCDFSLVVGARCHEHKKSQGRAIFSQNRQRLVQRHLAIAVTGLKAEFASLLGTDDSISLITAKIAVGRSRSKGATVSVTQAGYHRTYPKGTL